MTRYLVSHNRTYRTVPLALACLFCLCAYGAAQDSAPEVPRIESVRMASKQPHEDSQSLIWFDKFDTEKQYSESSDPPLDSSVRFGNSGMSMRCFYAAGSRGTGNRKVFFGDNPNTPLSRAGEKFDEVYWRIYVKHQAGWTGGGPAKMSRATSLISTNWRQMMISHIWSSGESLTLDPASGVPAGGSQVITTSYNDFNNLRWMGNKPVSEFKISSTEESGWWVCVEGRAKLNTPGLSDGENQLWIDGKLEAERLNVDWRGSYSSYGINSVFLEAYWNNRSPVDQNRWYDNFVISTSRIGPVVAHRNPKIFKTPFSGSGSQMAWEAQVALDRNGNHTVWSSNPVTEGDSVLVGTFAGTFSGRLAGENKLAPGTKYYFRVRQQNDSGQWSDWSYWHQEILTEGEAAPQGMGCDFNKDGQVGVADALALLILQMRHPDDLSGDYNGDGETGLSDVVVLIADIITGFCSSGQNLLAATGSVQAAVVLNETPLGLDTNQEHPTGGSPLPEAFNTRDNEPNPFSPSTTISFTLPESSEDARVSVRIVDLHKNLIRTLVDSSMPPGTHIVSWDGMDEHKNLADNGMYFYQVKTDEYTQTRKMLLLR